MGTETPARAATSAIVAGLPCRAFISISPSRVGGDCHLTAPLVMPEMIFRWATMKVISSGRLIRMM